MIGELLLRDVIDTDLPILFEHQRDSEAAQMAAFPARDWDAFMNHWAKVRGNATNITKTILVDGEVAGNIGSWEQFGEREVGYWIGRSYWGKGVASRALVSFVEQIEVRPLYAHVVKHNLASLRVLEKAGFTIRSEETETEDGVDEWMLVLNR